MVCVGNRRLDKWLMVEEIVVTGNKMLKGGDERPLWLWCFSRSRRLGASSIPLEPRLSVQPCVRPMHSQCRNPHRLNNSSGASQGPLVRASICACVMMVV